MKNKVLVLLICFFLICSPLYANAGSPIMWFGFLHLVFINLLIGLGETKIIKLIYKVEFRYSYIIIANYISMFIGLTFIAPYISKYGNNFDFWGGRTNYGDYEILGFYLGFLAAVLFSIIFEMPFFGFSNKTDKSLKTAFKYSLVANLISNTAMFLIYFLIIYPGSR